MEKKRRAEILFTGMFLAFLFVILFAIVFLPRNDTSYFENRALAPRPTLSAETILDGSFFQQVDDWLSDHTGGRNYLLKADTLFRLFVNVKLLHCPVVNETVVLDDMLLPFNEYETINPYAIEASAREQAKNMNDAREIVESYGGEYLFVAVPCQHVYYADRYPDYLNNRSAFIQTAKPALMDALAELGVNTLDMGEVLLRPENRDLAASRVDNHYTIYGAYLTYLEIMRVINAGRDTPLDVLEEGEFTISELPNHYMGSRTRKLFDLSSIHERLSILTPNHPIPFHRYYYGDEVAPEVYAMPFSPTENLDYGLYMGGDYMDAATLIDTERARLPSVMIYGDSFTNAVECIIYWSFGKMFSIDLRHYADMTLREYLEEFQPDYVVCIRDYAQVTNPTFNGGSVDSHGGGA